MDKYILKKFLLLIVIVLIAVGHLPGISNGKTSGSILNKYLLIAAENNPGLKAAFGKWKAEIERITVIKSLPDPEISLGYFINEVETKVGAQHLKIGLMQKFPFFGKLKSRGDKVLERARALEENVEKVKLEIFYNVKKLYYDYYFYSKSVEIIDKNISLLKAVNEQITSMYSTGTASYSDLIRIEIELEKLKDKKIGLENKLPSIRVSLNSVINRPVEKEILIDKEIRDITCQLNNSDLNRILRTNNPELKILDHIALSSEAGVKLARKNFLPDISVGADLIITGGSTLPGVIESGKDPFLIKMSMNIPLRFKKVNALIREAEIRREVIKYQKTEKENQLISILESTLFNINDSGRIIRLYRDSLIPKAETVFEVTKTAFSTGNADFLDFIDTQRSLLEFKLILEKFKSSRLQSLAFLEKIIGKKLNDPEKVKALMQEKM